MLVPEELKQDWAIFKAICPKEIMDILKSRKLTFENLFGIVWAVYVLEFTDLSLYLLVKNRRLVPKDWSRQKMVEELIIGKIPKKYDGRTFLCMIICNVENEQIRKHFLQLYSEESLRN